MRLVLVMLAACNGNGPSGEVFADRYRLSASFFEVPCANQTFGSCVARGKCLATQSSAGDLTAGTGMISFSLGLGAYEEIGDSSGYYGAGDSVPIAATGGDVPGFATTVDVPAPSSIDIVPITGVMVPRTSDLQISWEGGTGDVVVEIPPGNIDLRCTFPASDGIGRIPADALALVPPGRTELLFANSNTVTLELGEWTVSLITADSVPLKGETVLTFE